MIGMYDPYIVRFIEVEESITSSFHYRILERRIKDYDLKAIIRECIPHLNMVRNVNVPI